MHKETPKGTSLFFNYLKWHLSSLHTPVLKMQFLYTKHGWNVSKGLCFGTLVNRAIDKIKIFLLLTKREEKAITWIVQWIRPRGSHLLPPPEQGYRWDVLHLIKWCYSLFPAHRMPLCWISRSPIRIVSHWLSLRKGVFLFLCHISQRQNSMFVPSCQSWSVQHIWEQFKFRTNIKLLESPRVGSKVEKVTREGVCSKHLKKKKRIKLPNSLTKLKAKPRPEWMLWSPNYCHQVNVITAENYV